MKKNQSKMAAFRTGIKTAKGDIVIIQDADLEYDPQEYPLLVGSILEDKADLVFGSHPIRSMVRGQIVVLSTT